MKTQAVQFSEAVAGRAAAGLVNWSEVMRLVTESRGERFDRLGDDRFKFPDGSVALVRGMLSGKPRIDLTSPECPPFFGDVLDVIGRLKFVYAKTMPLVPHEYTVRLKAENDADYIALYETIMREGVIEFWRGCDGKLKNHQCRPARYLYPGDGWRYWSMSPKRTVKPFEDGRHPLAIARHVNRCTIEEVDRLRKRGWIFTAKDIQTEQTLFSGS
jgi:hypothetical protein